MNACALMYAFRGSEYNSENAMEVYKSSGTSRPFDDFNPLEFCKSYSGR